MAYHRITEPVPHTCPLIDEVISAIESVDWEETYWEKSKLIETMEKIREANSTLRSWGVSNAETALEFEANFDELKDEQVEINDRNELEVSELNYKIVELEQEISDLKEEIIQIDNYYKSETK